MTIKIFYPCFFFKIFHSKSTNKIVRAFFKYCGKVSLLFGYYYFFGVNLISRSNSCRVSTGCQLAYFKL